MLAKQLSAENEVCNTLRVLSLFSGIGAFEKALLKLGVPFTIEAYSEIDKYASRVYSYIHNIREEDNLGDISKVDPSSIPDVDLVTYGFPCQDISTAGKGAGINEGTRSGLLYHAIKIIEAKKPAYAIAENVKNLIGKKHRKDFDKLLIDLDKLGYINYWKVLNSNKFGIPQSRERVFVISIRKDIDQGFQFPKEYFNDLKLADLLEKEVDEAFFINEKKTQLLLDDFEPASMCQKTEEKEVYPYLTPEIITKGQNGRRFRGREGDMYTLTSKDRHGIVFNTGKRREGSLGVNQQKEYKTHGQRTGIIEIGKLNMKGFESTKRVYSPQGISPTLVTKNPPKIPVYRVRKLTPLECWRLMGFDDIDFYRAKYVLNKTFYQGRERSDSQLYKMAGNSIVVNVLVEIMRNLFNPTVHTKLKKLKVYYGAKDNQDLQAKLVNETYSTLQSKCPDYLKRIA